MPVFFVDMITADSSENNSITFMFYTFVCGPLAGNAKDIAPENLKEENTPTSNEVTIPARLHCSPQ
jgi:hypothetical protein